MNWNIVAAKKRGYQVLHLSKGFLLVTPTGHAVGVNIEFAGLSIGTLDEWQESSKKYVRASEQEAWNDAPNFTSNTDLALSLLTVKDRLEIIPYVGVGVGWKASINDGNEAFGETVAIAVVRAYIGA